MGRIQQSVVCSLSCLNIFYFCPGLTIPKYFFITLEKSLAQ